jgi:hypothetical protein
MGRAVPNQPSPKRGERPLVNVTFGHLFSTGDVTRPSAVGRKTRIGCAGLGRSGRRRPNRSSSTRTSSSKVLRRSSRPAVSYGRRPVGTHRPLCALRRACLDVAVLDLVKATTDQLDGRSRHVSSHCGPCRAGFQVCGPSPARPREDARSGSRCDLEPTSPFPVSSAISCLHPLTSTSSISNAGDFRPSAPDHLGQRLAANAPVHDQL